MNPIHFQDIWRLRNKLMRGMRDTEIQSQLTEMGVSLSGSGLASFVYALSKSVGTYQFPGGLGHVIVRDVGATVVCDPWAGFGAVISTVREAIGKCEAFAFSANDNEPVIGKAVTEGVDGRLVIPSNC
jgi:hypothetical protein